MRRRFAVLLAVLLGVTGLAASAEAQDAPPPAAGARQGADAAPAAAIDATKLGVDLNRIRSGLEKSETEERWSAERLRLDTRIQVFGHAPLPDFFEDFDPVAGPVPYGAPTHGQMLDVMTPMEFKAPAANFAALAFWAIQKIGERGARQRCEEELAQYRRQVMAGIQVAAPSCAR
jgi:hypothetical protein